MRWPILFAGVFVAIAFWWALRPAPHDNPGISVPELSASSVATGQLSKPENAVTQQRAQIAPVSSRGREVTEDRRRILDSKEILKTIEKVSLTGTPDEKEWAMSLYSSCYLLFAKVPPIKAELAAQQQQSGASAPDGEMLAELKKRASDTLRERCHGIENLSAAERAKLKDDLRVPEGQKTSRLDQLNAITDAQPGMWSPSQAKLLDDSLYSDDPIIAKAAFFAVLHGIDWNAPGGQERQTALLRALGAQYTQGTQSEFEALQDCRILEQCGVAPSVSTKEPTPTASVLELEKKYQDAWATHQGARAILAIH